MGRPAGASYSSFEKTNEGKQKEKQPYNPPPCPDPVVRGGTWSAPREMDPLSSPWPGC